MIRMRRVLLAIAALPFLIAGHASAHMVAKPVSWTFEGTRYGNVLVYDDTTDARRPGLLMVPAWFGVNENAIRKAEDIAGQRYVILLTDMYGATIRPKDTAGARDAVSPLLADRSMMRRRIAFALARFRALASQAPIDTGRLAAIGYCFGGAAVLDLARSGADIAAVVAFHGNLSTDDPTLAHAIRAHVLAMNGADDTTTTPQFDGFLAEMRSSPAPWQFLALGHAVHCFTEKEATAPTGLCRYDARADAWSSMMMHAWLDASFPAQ